MSDEPFTLKERKPTHLQACAAVRTLIAYLGDDPDRAGLQGTPQRVLKAWRTDWGAGYGEPPSNLLTLFDADPLVNYVSQEEWQRQAFIGIKGGQRQPPPMVMVRDLSYSSHCEHHLAPFFGQARIAYIPGPRGKIGLSKFARIIDHYARRLQVQERLTDEIADYLVTNLAPDVAVTLSGTHLCMVSRGVKQPHALTVTSALRGAFYDDPATRAEFFSGAA